MGGPVSSLSPWSWSLKFIVGPCLQDEVGEIYMKKFEQNIRFLRYLLKFCTKSHKNNPNFKMDMDFQSCESSIKIHSTVLA